MARPKKEIPPVSPEQMVFNLAILGHSKAEIARLLDIDPHTLESRFSTEYAKGKETGKQKLRAKLMSMALAGNVSCLIFALKNLAGFSDKVSTELSGPEGSPIQVDDARNKLAGLLSGIAAKQPAPSDPGAAN